MIEKVNLAEKLGRVDRPWTPKIVGAANGQHLKVVRLEGEFVWHAHDDADEVFFVLSGTLELQLEDGVVRLGPGELAVVPRGVRHCPRAAGPVEALLLEPAGTVNTGDAGGEKTVADPEWI